MFIDFGKHIKTLAQNLNNIVRVVENARLQHQQLAIRSPNFRGVFLQKEWDLSSLYDIVGPFRATLTDCEQLLFQYRNSNLNLNKERTRVTNLKCDGLRQKVRAHSIKNCNRVEATRSSITCRHPQRVWRSTLPGRLRPGNAFASSPRIVGG